MGTTAEKLQRVLDSKNAVKNSIINKGGNITDTTPFIQYATAIDNLPSGASNGEPLVVEELPTENINEKAIYQLNDVIKDIVINDNLGVNYMSGGDYNVSFLQVQTRPTENIIESTMEKITIYYIVDENDAFAYFNIGQGPSFLPLSSLFYAILSVVLPYKGTIYNLKEVNDIGYYVLLHKKDNFVYENKKLRETFTLEEAMSLIFSQYKPYIENVEVNIEGNPFGGEFLGDKYGKVKLNYYHSVNGAYIANDMFAQSDIKTLIINDYTNLGIVFFSGCFSLANIQNIILNGTIKSFSGNGPFFSDSSIAKGDGYIYVPDETVDTVKAYPNFSEYASQIKPMTEFADKESYNYKIENDKVKITSYKDNLPYVGIPSTIDDYQVTNIGEDVFMENKNIVSVKLPSTLETISNRAFFLCSNINTIEIPSSVTTIGSYGLWLSAIFEGEKTIIFKSSIPPTIQANSLPEVREGTLIIKVPVGYGDVYKTWDTNWEALASYIVEGE